MPFIRCQRLKFDENGLVVSGSASIIISKYQKNQKYHSKQIVKEKLGKVLWLSDDNKKGIFLSPTRGLVEYCSTTDSFSSADYEDERLTSQNLFPVPERHVIFGDVYWLLKFVEKCGLGSVLRRAFPDEKLYSRLLCHVLHSILRDGGRISCDNFISKSFASHLFSKIPLSTLRSDSPFFVKMGEDASRLAFFKSFVEEMRKEYPSFGKGCYVDSTALPNDIANNPFNALSNHGVGGTCVQSRLVLILDRETGLPVWYNIIPGNVLDINTVRSTLEDVAASIGIEIDSMILDAGYVSKDLILALKEENSDKSWVGKMPNRKGFGYKELYNHYVKPSISQGKYTFLRGKHIYFGKKVIWKVFDQEMFAYVYVDKENAVDRLHKYIHDHPDSYAKMKDSEKTWMEVRGGYFVLLSNLDKTPEEMLDTYFGRTEIESVFKSSKDYLRMLPLSKWTAETVRGKILLDVINTSILLLLRKKIGPSKVSVSELIGKTQALMCYLISESNVGVERASRQAREYYGLLDLTPPTSVNLVEFCQECGLPM